MSQTNQIECNMRRKMVNHRVFPRQEGRDIGGNAKTGRDNFLPFFYIYRRFCPGRRTEAFLPNK